MPTARQRLAWRHLDLAEGETIRQHAEAYQAQAGKALRKDPVASEATFLALADKALNPTHVKVPLSRRILALPDGTRFLTVLTRGAYDGAAVKSDVAATNLALDQRADGSGPTTIHAGVRYAGQDLWLPVRVVNNDGSDARVHHYTPCLPVRAFSKTAKPPNEPRAIQRSMVRCNDYVRDLVSACRALEVLPITLEYGVALLGLAAVTCLRPHVRAKKILAATSLFVRRARTIKGRQINVLDVLWALNHVVLEAGGLPVTRAMRIAEAWATFILAEVSGGAAWPREGDAASVNLRPSTPEETAPALPFETQMHPPLLRADGPATEVTPRG